MPEHLTRFVPPDPPPPRMQILPPAELPPAPISQPMPHSSHLDRSRGFMLVTTPLAAATGVVALLVAISAFGVPFVSVAALLCVLGGFSVVWLVGLISFQLISAEGAIFLHTVLLWRMLLLEAKERRKRYGLKK